MTLKQFMKDLSNALSDRDFSKSEIDEIIEDYTLMIQEASDRGEDETTFIERLGKPKEIARSIRKENKSHASKDSKLIALSPFIALIVFFITGFYFDAWHPGWMVFLLIPMTAILLEVHNPLEKLTALSPFIALIGFMTLGTYQGLWHPMWALFLIIPALGFLSSRHLINKIFGLYTFVAMTLFIIYTLVFEPSNFYAFLILLPILVMGILSGEITIIWDNKYKSLRLLALNVIALILLLAIYIYIGVTHEMWHPTWLMFLALPVGSLLYSKYFLKEHIELVAFMPFIALIIFFLVGEYLNAYHISWLAFLLIPMTAILFSGEKVVEVKKNY